MAWATPDYTLADADVLLRISIDLFKAREGLRYGFFDKAKGAFVGNGSFHHIDWSVPKLELGYWLRTSRSGEGLMREGVRAFAEMAERDLGAMRLEIRCDDLNERSARVAEACDFMLEGTLRNECRDPRGRLRDTRLYARVPQ